MPNARSDSEAASMLARSLPEGLVKASKVVEGERSARMSSVSRSRVGEREGVCAPGLSRGVMGERMVGGFGESIVYVCCFVSIFGVVLSSAHGWRLLK
jgi:hypothetical protein